jgi:hypothetical protein
MNVEGGITNSPPVDTILAANDTLVEIKDSAAYVSLLAVLGLAIATQPQCLAQFTGDDAAQRLSVGVSNVAGPARPVSAGGAAVGCDLSLCVLFWLFLCAALLISCLPSICRNCD